MPRPTTELIRFTDRAMREPERGTPMSEVGRVGVVKRAFKGVGEHNLTNIAAALAYYAFLAIPSVLLVAVGVFALVGNPGDVESLVNRLGKVVPEQAQQLIQDSLSRMTGNTGTGIAVLVIGILLGLWSVTGAMQTLMWGLNIVYEREETRGFVAKRLAALKMVGFAALGIVLVFGLLVLGPQLIHWIGDAVGQKEVVTWVWWTAQWPILIVGVLVAFAGMYYLGPNVEHPRWRVFTFGAGFALVVWLALSGLFSFYVSRFGSYNKTWGALAAVVILLTWLWLTSLAVLLGAEVNAQSERGRGGSGEPQPEAKA